jgi:hypothetical protein
LAFVKAILKQPFCSLLSPTLQYKIYSSSRYLDSNL